MCIVLYVLSYVPYARAENKYGMQSMQRKLCSMELVEFGNDVLFKLRLKQNCAEAGMSEQVRHPKPTVTIIT